MAAFFKQGDTMKSHSVRMTMLGGMLAAFACTGTCQALPTEAALTASAPATAASAALPATRGNEGAPPQERTRQVAGLGTPAPESRLSRSRGGTETVSNAAALSATVTNNTADHVSSGSNIIEGGSFANMTGLPMVIQNSGSNVLIQNATVINLQLK